MLLSNSSNYAEVLPDQLLFGDIFFSKDVRAMRKMKIGAVVDLCHYRDIKSRVKYSHEIDPLYHPVYDTPTNNVDWAEKASAFIEEEIKKEKLVYVHCYYGMSRSTTLVLHYLMTRCQMTLKQAYTFLKEKRPIICPTYGFMKSLAELDEQLYGTVSLTAKDYSIQCIADVFPNASIDTINEKYAESERLLQEKENKFIEDVMARNNVSLDKIEPKGFITIELLKAEYDFRKRESCVDYHPFQ